MPPDRQSFVAIGRPNDPRWLAPAGTRLRDESFLGWRPYRLVSRLAWAALKPAMCWGVVPAALSPDDSYLQSVVNLDWRALGWGRPSLPEPLVYVGNPGPRRKAIVHLIDPVSHACELIVKVPIGEDARRAIGHEAQTLIELQQEEFAAAPRLIELDQAAGIASQTVMTGARARLKLSRELGVLLRSLERREEGLSLRSVASSLEPKVRKLGATAADSEALMRALAEMDDDTQLPAVRIHGDFAPWNIKLRNGIAGLIDWEDSQARGLPFHDAYHFVHMARCLFGKQPRQMCEELRLRYEFRLSAAQLCKLEVAYIVQMLARECPRPEQMYVNYLLATLRKAVAG